MKKLFLLTVTKLSWALSFKKRSSAFIKFSIIEKNSAAQILSFLNFIENNNDRARVFTHANDEFNHSKLFYKIAQKENPGDRFEITGSEKSYFHKSRKEFLNDLAYVCVSENSVNHDFLNYKRSLKSVDEIAAFDLVEKDEFNHYLYTKELLRKLSASDFELKFILLKARARRIYEQYIHYTKIIGDYMMIVPISLAYLVLGALSFNEARKRIQLEDDKNSKILFEEYQNQVNRMKS